MILKDPPQTEADRLPADQLSDSERLNRLFHGGGRKWRLLAVLAEDSGAGGLLLPELRDLVDRFCRRGLLTRIVFLNECRLHKLDRDMRSWMCPNTRASGMDIHASRIVEDSPLPLVNLYSPDGQLDWSRIGFDTELGLDDLVERLEDCL